MNWKVLTYFSENELRLEGKTVREIPNVHSLAAKKYRLKGTIELASGAPRILVKRDPMERLVSSWVDKVLYGNKAFFEKYPTDWLLAWRSFDHTHLLNSFAEFESSLQGSSISFDPHFMAQSHFEYDGLEYTQIIDMEEIDNLPTSLRQSCNFATGDLYPAKMLRRNMTPAGLVEAIYAALLSRSRSPLSVKQTELQLQQIWSAEKVRRWMKYRNSLVADYGVKANKPQQIQGAVAALRPLLVQERVRID